MLEQIHYAQTGLYETSRLAALLCDAAQKVEINQGFFKVF